MPDQYRVHLMPVNGRCPRCGVEEWDTKNAPLTERRAEFAPLANCPIQNN